MSYNVQSIAVFEKQAKKLIKKYTSLKGELLDLVSQLKDNPLQGIAIDKIIIRYGYQLPPKEREKAAVPGLLPIL